VFLCCWLSTRAFALANIAISPESPSEGDHIQANYWFYSTGPVVIEKRTVSTIGAEVNVLIQFWGGGHDPALKYDGSIDVGVLPVGEYGINLVIQYHSDPDLPLGAPEIRAQNVFVVKPVSEPSRKLYVKEFYHSGLNHYFITANASEAAGLVANPALGWTATGYGFDGIDPAQAIESEKPVCRFYGSPNPGPNSHFFTADAAECSQLMAIQAITPSTVPRWNLESTTAFAIASPVSGMCPPNHSPVRRFYNGRAQFGDSNHRYTVKATTAQEMIAKGWLDEGIVMCGAP
jgi:hypothetical protein